MTEEQHRQAVREAAVVFFSDLGRLRARSYARLAYAIDEAVASGIARSTFPTNELLMAGWFCRAEGIGPGRMHTSLEYLRRHGWLTT